MYCGLCKMYISFFTFDIYCLECSRIYRLIKLYDKHTVLSILQDNLLYNTKLCQSTPTPQNEEDDVE